MSNTIEPGHVLPKPGLLKTIGVLNIVFGAIMLLCIPCFAGYVGLLANMGPLLQAQQQEIQKRVDEQMKRRLDDLAKREATAQNEEQKEQIRIERDNLKSAPGPPQTPNIDFMFGSFREPRVLAHYIGDWSTAMIMNVLMLAAGIGLVKMRSWGRTLGIWVAGIKIVRHFILCGFSLMVVIPITSRSLIDGMGALDKVEQAEAGLNAADAAKKGLPPPPPPQQGGKEAAQAIITMSTFWSIFMLIGGSIYPIVTLVILTRPAAKAACDASEKAANPGENW